MAEISPAEVREVRKRLKTILVTNLGYGKLGHDKVVVDVLAFAFQHPLVGGLSERILEDTAEGGYTVAPNWAKVSTSFASGSSASRNTGNCGYTGKSGA